VDFILDQLSRNKLFGIPHEPLVVLNGKSIGLRFLTYINFKKGKIFNVK